MPLCLPQLYVNLALLMLSQTGSSECYSAPDLGILTSNFVCVFLFQGLPGKAGIKGAKGEPVSECY